MFAKQLRACRRALGLTQAELAAAAGVSASAIGMYEQGRRIPTRKVYNRLALLFLRSGLRLAPLPAAPEGPPQNDIKALLKLLRE